MKLVKLGLAFGLGMASLAHAESVHERDAGAEARKKMSTTPKQDQFFIIAKTSWDRQDEDEFSQFIAKLGAASCTSLQACLKSPANPYRDSDPDDLQVVADCADFPYMLRAYFAWKKGLPFSVASGLESKDAPPTDGSMIDHRKTVNGNRITARTDFTAESVRDESGRVINGRHYSIQEMFDMVHNRISSSMYRTDPRDENPRAFSDFYPPTLDRENIRPGTLIYSPDGHVAVVHHVADNGDVHYMQASTDYSVSRGVFNKSAFPQSRTEHGAGFRNWRPQVLTGAEAVPVTDATGNSYHVFVDGKIQGESDDSLRQKRKLSLEQYQRHNGKYQLAGQNLAWEDYVTASLSREKWQRRPVRDFNKRLITLCTMVQNRESQVEIAREQGLPFKAHPERLPRNIYMAEPGEWEAVSTPGRDATIRGTIADLGDFIQQMLGLSKTQLEQTDYKGDNLARDLQREYERLTSLCPVQYKNSHGKTITLTLGDVIRRADKMSFDPYHCPELRWGATGREAATCQQAEGSMEWYQAQAPLRTQRSRDTAGKYDYDLTEARSAFLRMGEKASFDLASLF